MTDIWIKNNGHWIELSMLACGIAGLCIGLMFGRFIV